MTSSRIPQIPEASARTAARTCIGISPFISRVTYPSYAFRRSSHSPTFSPLVPLPPRLAAGPRERGSQFTVDRGVARARARPEGGHARAGPGLRARVFVDLPASRIRRAGLGGRSLVQRRGEHSAHTRRRRRRWCVSAACGRALTAIRAGVLRRDRERRLVSV